MTEDVRIIRGRRVVFETQAGDGKPVDRKSALRRRAMARRFPKPRGRPVAAEPRAAGAMGPRGFGARAGR